METIFDRPLFSVGDKEYSGKDVLLAAMIRNDWEAFEIEVRKGMACVKAAEDNDEDFEEEIESSAVKWRYEHNLVAADDLTSWLDERQIDVEEWLGYVQRSMLVQKWSHQLDDILAKYPAADQELAQIIECDAICSGTLNRFSIDLAGRAAIYLKKEDPIPSTEFQSQEIPIQPANILQLDVDQEQLRHLWKLEEFFQWFSRISLTEEAIQNHIRSHFMDWTQFRYKHLSFPREEIAQEAALCIKEDGLDFDVVAKQAKIEATEEIFYYDDLADALKDLFMIVQKGSLVGPLRFNQGFSLFWITDRFAPAEENPEITKKAKRDLLQKISDREITDHVRWHFRF